MKILTINPGSTSTKLAVYEDEKELYRDSIEYDADEILKYDAIADQAPMRMEFIEKSLEKHGIKKEELDAVVGRGGAVAPIEAGAYEVNEKMVDRLINNPVTHHASNLGAILGLQMHKDLGVPAYIYDAVSTDQLADIIRITGVKAIGKVGTGHALNMRATALKAAKEMGKPYEECRFVVAHLGGGISLSAHENGRMADMVSDDDGPFSPERSGALPLRGYTNWAFDMGKEKALKYIARQSGLADYLGTKDVREVEKRIAEGDEYAALVYDAMVLQISKSIAQLATYLCGDVDAILLTGGIAYSEKIQQAIRDRVGFIAEVKAYPGENELKSLAEGALRVLRGEEEAHVFTGNE